MPDTDTKDPLITLLTGMPGVSETDFHKRVMSRVHVQELRKKVAYMTAWSCAIVAIFLSLPLARILAPLTSLTKTLQVMWNEAAAAEQIPNLTHWHFQTGNMNLLIVSIAAALIILITSTTLSQE